MLGVGSRTRASLPQVFPPWSITTHFSVQPFVGARMGYFDLAANVLTNPKHSRWVADCLLVGEAVLCALIIWKVPCKLRSQFDFFPAQSLCFSETRLTLAIPDTEIDWKTYMQQVSLFINGGETDYYKLTGDTGPLVYPALHVYLYSALYYLTDGGTNILQAQIIFAFLYLVTVALVLSCYRRVGAPPWLLATLVCSKRLHSIFLLRLFNDAWAALMLWTTVYAFQRRWWSIGGFVWSMGVGIKMTMLLITPAVGMIVLQGHGTSEASFIGMFSAMFQMISSFPFVFEGRGAHYLYRAFDLGRKFLFKWTVNWRFVGEEVFSSTAFAGSLLAVHVSLLFTFFQYRWIKPSSERVGEFLHKYTRTMNWDLERSYEKKVTPTFVMDTVLGCMAIGMLCARSLHYQFYAYLGWATPYLLWRSGVNPVLVVANLVLQELAWLQYPSTTVSSITVVVELMVAVVSIWYGSAYTPEVKLSPEAKAEPGEEAAKSHSE